MVVLESSISKEWVVLGLVRTVAERKKVSSRGRRERERFACVHVCGPHTASQQHQQPPKLSPNWFRTKLEQTNKLTNSNFLLLIPNGFPLTWNHSN